ELDQFQQPAQPPMANSSKPVRHAELHFRQMIFRAPPQTPRRAMTLIEMLTALGLGSIILAAAGIMYLFVVRSFTMAGNYADLDASSRYAVDAMLKEMRQSTLVTSYQSTSTNSWLSLTNAMDATSVTYSWNSDSRNLV